MAVIEVENVKQHFKDIKAVDGVSLEVKEGTVYGLLGPNGAGKTTLVRGMATLLRPTAGSIRIHGIDTVEHADRVRPMIGLAGQFASVDEFQTGRENLEMVGRLYHLGRKESKLRAMNILKDLGLTGAADRTVKTYSGGMRRRLDLGASLVGKPKVLFLDEPTTGLDPRTRLDLWNTIRGLVAGGTTILLTTQYLEEADELANKIGVIDNGKLIAEGTADQLKNKLGADVVEFTLKESSQSEEALKAVRSVAKKKPTYTDEHQRVRVPVVDGSKSMLRIAQALDDVGIDPVEISLHRPSLDDVFLNITGNAAKSTEKKPKNNGSRS